MENRIQDMDTILKDLYFTVKEQNIILNEKLVYNYLIKRDVSSQELGINVNGVTFDEYGNYEQKEILSTDFFSRWIKRFASKDNIRVFCNPGWRYFCQFENGDFSHISQTRDFNCVKMYIPLDYAHLYEGANRIFDFLARENICHRSKISSKFRFDNIVVRLPNLEDAKKLQNFIDNDAYIQKGLMKGNVFSFQNNGISYAMDGMLSYNCYLSSLISEYINEMNVNQRVTVQDVSVHSFQQYVRNISNNFDSMKFHLLPQEKSSCYLKENIADAYGIIRLLDMALSSNDMKKFEEHFQFLNHKMGRATLLEAIENGFELEKASSEDNSKEELLKEFILTTMKKYPRGYDKKKTDVSGLQYILSYLNGNDKSVTRDHDLRNRMKNEISRDEIWQIINSSGIMGNDIVIKLVNYVKVVMLNDIISSMNQRMPHCAIANIEKFMRTNQLSLITNSVGNARQLAKTLKGPAIMEFLQSLGMKDLNEYIENYYVAKNYGYGRR